MAVFPSLADFNAHVASYDSFGLHYSLIAEAIYSERRKVTTDPLSSDYLRFVVAGLVLFDMGRHMGPASLRYSEFLSRLSRVINDSLVTERLTELDKESLEACNLGELLPKIQLVHKRLSERESGIWVRKEKQLTSRVGASKILHWLYPDLFLMVDNNTMKVLGYGEYPEQMARAKQIVEDLKLHASNFTSPLPRVIDKALFAKAGNM